VGATRAAPAYHGSHVDSQIRRHLSGAIVGVLTGCGGELDPRCCGYLSSSLGGGRTAGALYSWGYLLLRLSALVLVWPLVPGSREEFGAVLLLSPLLIALFGVPFLMMARPLTTIVERQPDGTPGSEA